MFQPAEDLKHRRCSIRVVVDHLLADTLLARFRPTVACRIAVHISVWSQDESVCG